jgi:hypothetical protein
MGRLSRGVVGARPLPHSEEAMLHFGKVA